MASDYARLLKEVSDMRRKMANMIRSGSVEEVAGDKLRINYGNDENGQPVLSPWIHHSNHRGGSRERRFFKGPSQQAGGQGGGGAGGSGGGGGGQGGGKGGQNGGGQNVTIICPDGDTRQAFVVPFAPNKGHPPPDHANESGQGEETWQEGENRYSRSNDGYDWWLEDEEGGGGQRGQSGGGGQQQEQRKVGGDKAKVKLRYTKDAMTMRHGSDNHLTVRKEGPIMRATDENYMWADKDGDVVRVKSKKPPTVSQPWVIASVKPPDADKA